MTGPVHVQTALGTATGPVFTVTTEQDVSFSASPAAVTVFQGSSSNVSLALASFGTKEFDGLMQLSVTGLPNGVTARFMPTHLARGQSGTLVLSAAASSPVVTNQDIVVTATNVSGGLVTARNATVRVSVQSAVGVTGVRGRFITPEGAGIGGFRIAVQDIGGTLIAQAISDAGGNFVLTGLPRQRHPAARRHARQSVVPDLAVYLFPAGGRRGATRRLDRQPTAPRH